MRSGAVAAFPWRVHPTLPVFRLDRDEESLFYTPGNVGRFPRAQAREVEAALNGDGAAGGTEARLLAAQLEEWGSGAVRAWDALASKPFEPECLTIYLSNRCNLACSYCFAAPAEPARAAQRLRLIRGDEADEHFPLIPEAAISAAARVVARHSARAGKPLTLVIHGGGEPTLHWSLLQRARGVVSAIAADHGVSSWAYIATHGALPVDRARWLAANFDLIGLSCDGPPSIQDGNRPFAAGGETSAMVERTARVLRELGTRFTVRASITPATVTRQSEIVAYACETLGTTSIRFEPVYDGRRSVGPHFLAEDAEAFVEGFVAARELAARLGCTLDVSGMRPDEIHGPYCNPLREVLQVTPDGVGTACFLSTGNEDTTEETMALGRFDAASGEFEIDDMRAALLRRRAARIPARCESCMNLYHCARDCPDVCVITASTADEREAGFRCRVHKLLALHWLSTR